MRCPRVLPLLPLLPLLFAASIARAQTPIVMSHDGFLLGVDDQPVTRTAVSFEFTIWSNAIATDPEFYVWPIEGSAACPIDVTKGYYVALLGAGGTAGGCGAPLSSQALPFGSPRFLQVSIDGTVMMPRLRIGTAPHAAVAATALDAEKLGGLARDGFWEKTWDVSAAKIGAATLGDALARLAVKADPNTFTGENVFTAATRFGGAGALTTISGDSITTGNVTGNLTGNVAGNVTGSGAGLLQLSQARLTDGASNTLAQALAAPSGDGSGITKLSTAVVRAELPTNLAKTDGVNAFVGAQTFGDGVIGKGAGTQIVASPASGDALVAANRGTAAQGKAGFVWQTGGSTKWSATIDANDDGTLNIAANGTNRLTLMADGTVLVPGTLTAAGVGPLPRRQTKITVPGLISKFYPVWFPDGCWDQGETELSITRTSVHEDTNGRGSMVAKFRYHNSAWGNGSEYQELFYRSHVTQFIGRYSMPYVPGGMAVWLRGGGTSYFYWSNCPTTPQINPTAAIEGSLIVYTRADYPHVNVVLDPLAAGDVIAQGWTRSH